MMKLDFKTPKIRSKEHRAFIASKPCLISGRMGSDIHPHHLLRAGDKAMGTKACDSLCVPLYYMLHDALHRMGNEVAFFANHGIEYEDVEAMAELYSSISPDKRIRATINFNPRRI